MEIIEKVISQGIFIDSAPLVFYEIFQTKVRGKQIHQTFDIPGIKIVFMYKKKKK